MTLLRRLDHLDLAHDAMSPAVKALLAPPERTGEGFLIVEGVAARTGIQIYSDGAGGLIREYRPPDEVHASESLRSYEGRPFVDDHPAGYVEPTTARRDTRGALLAGRPHPEHGVNVARVIIYDAQTIAAVDGGKRQLSLGYYARVDLEPGTSPSGERYDAVQRGIRINHLALVDRARAGAVAQLRLDGEGHAVPAHPQEVTTVAKTQVQIGGSALLLDEADAPAVLAAAQKLIDAGEALKAFAATETARADALAGEVKVLKAQPSPKTDADEIEARVDARIALLTEAALLLPEGYKATGRTDAQIRQDACEHALGEPVTEAEAVGAYKLLLLRAQGTAQSKQDALAATSQRASGAPPASVDAARASFLAVHAWSADKARNGL